ncbi:MAG: thiamine phosphate synthase [Tepidisphaeraceae bacterium]
MSDAVLRILDANLNRAREGLRVVEDYVRFVLDDAGLWSELKAIRHRLAAATDAWAAKAVGRRDTSADVGTAAPKLASEASRESAERVVIASCKRVAEALRTTEEYLKTLDAQAAHEVERTRYAFYIVEQKLSLRVAGKPDFSLVRLYVLITESVCSRPWLEAAEQAIAGGADCLQLREKELDAGELLKRARKLVELCRAHDVTSIVNDRADIALLSGADGVHVGQGDLSCRDARRIVGASKLIGVSTHEIAHARQAQLDGADYIGVGPIFRSGTKPRDFISGLDYAKQVAGEITVPVVGIAGITLDNVDRVLATGMRAIAVTAAVVGASDITAAARAFKERLIGSAPPARVESQVGEPS